MAYWSSKQVHLHKALVCINSSKLSTFANGCSIQGCIMLLEVLLLLLLHTAGALAASPGPLGMVARCSSGCCWMASWQVGSTTQRGISVPARSACLWSESRAWDRPGTHCSCGSRGLTDMTPGEPATRCHRNLSWSKSQCRCLRAWRA